MGEGKTKNKRSIAQMTLVYLVAAAMIAAVLIMGVYSTLYSKTILNESYSQIDSFEDTYKFMMGKESQTTDDVDADLSVPEKLIASAERMSGQELKTGDIETGSGSDTSEEKKLIEKGVDYQSAVDDLASAFGCDFLSLKSDGNGDYFITAATNGYTSYERLSDLGLVSLLGSTDDRGHSIVRMNGNRCLAVYTKVFDTKLEPDDAALMIMPLKAFISRSSVLTATLVFVILAVCITLAVWLISIYRRIAGGSLTDEQETAFSYRRIKIKAVIAVIACALISYICAAFSMSIDSVFIRTSRGSATLQALFSRLDDDVERTEVQWKSSQKRYTENAKVLAELIDSNRSLQNRAWLKEASGIIEADYIMIFDADGNEIISDSQYKGISLKEYRDPDMADFGRLLNGVESISHAGVHDEITGLTRDYHGICLNYLADKDSYGAMLIAVDPEEHTWIRFSDIDNVMDSMAPVNGFIMEVDPDTGVVAHSSNRSLTGTKLSEKDTNDLFLGYLKIGQKQYYAASASHGGSLYYYCIDKNYMFRDVLPFTMSYTLLFLAVFVILCVILLREYPAGEEGTKKAVIFSEKATDSISAFIEKAAEVNEKLLSVSNTPHINRRLMKLNDWDATPEREAMSILELLLFLFTMSVGIVLLLRRRVSAGGTVLDFILTGKWTHGPNLFSFAAVYFLFCALFAVLAMLKLLSAVLNTALSKRALTITSLLLNILFYAALLAFLFISLSFLGVNTKALIASAGFVGLAVSLSLQDILSDVFSGLMLIAGRTYEVGDYIEIRDAGSGTVKMIGLRRTELIADSGKTFSIRNSRINNVINHSRDGEGSECRDKNEEQKKEGKN